MPYHHFTTEERYVISHMNLAAFSLREIGRHIGRHHTSVSREIRRNRPAYADDAVYWYEAAESYAKECSYKARHRKRKHDRLVAYVTAKLRLTWSLVKISLFLLSASGDAGRACVPLEVFCQTILIKFT